MDQWKLPSVTNQYDFFRRHIAPTIKQSDRNRVFVVVSDAGKRARIGELYRESFYLYAKSEREQGATRGAGEQYEQQRLRVVKSAVHLANHMGEVPLMIIPCINGRVEKMSPMAQAMRFSSVARSTSPSGQRM